MKNFVDFYWNKRLEKCKKNLENNNFIVHIANSISNAEDIVINEILPQVKPKSASCGDSQTLHATNIISTIRQNPKIKLIETFSKNVSMDIIEERRRQALLVDIFFTGSNAITETGKLVNLDMECNRIAGITFGPKNVIIIIGRNKIVSDIDEAIKRIKNYAAPLNALRNSHFVNTPCNKTSYCIDCNSPDRICNAWLITEKSYPKNRIKIILINEDVGL
ncbi:MAG TPA: lactate utilization protein [Victivallales bacterium]|nr:lactate utilization protein [Victivallales bacterium]